MNPAVQLTASVAAIVVLFGIARWLGLGRDARIVDEAQAMQIAFDNHFDLTPTCAIVDRAGGAALVRDTANRLILIKAHGAHFATRMIVPPIEGRLDHQFLTLVAEDAAFGAVTLNLGDQAQFWANEILGTRDEDCQVTRQLLASPPAPMSA